MYTHLDGKNHVLHNHIIVNKVNLETGKKLREQKGESVQRAREMNDRLASRENWHILEPPKERQTETEKELIAKNEYSYMDDLRERINKSLQDVSVSSYKMKNLICLQVTLCTVIIRIRSHICMMFLKVIQILSV